MTGTLGEADLSRIARDGGIAITDKAGLALFDESLRRNEPVLVPSPMDLGVLRNQAKEGTLPALLSGLVRSRARRRTVDTTAVASGGERSALLDKLAGLDADGRATVLLDLVCGHVATVLGHQNAAAVDPRRGFLEMGFDSLTGIELRNRLNAATGQRLPATLIFDYPAPELVAQYIADAMPSDGVAAKPQDGPDDLELELAGIAEKIDAASDDEIFDFIDNELKA
ncbi:hypothetical protein DMH04_30440 [Kibdelosporangium aridum]|uniref:Carrier domain-containing protein n=2 Tax=Kibdelosporangium aridum TaxID=2030 RepID=A0A428Z325_KIBAR|nr:hypothetical protein DMH04_30440 [Kibdelosporangium aridum]